MDKRELNKSLKIAGFNTIKEFANLFELNPKSVNNWGTSQNIPYWVESWLKNYIELQEAKATIKELGINDDESIITRLEKLEIEVFNEKKNQKRSS